MKNPCPECSDGKLEIRRNHQQETWFYGCTNYPQCRHTASVATASTPPPPAERVDTPDEIAAKSECERIGFEARKAWHEQHGIPFPEDKEVFPDGFTAEMAFALLYKCISEMAFSLPYDKTKREPVESARRGKNGD